MQTGKRLKRLHLSQYFCHLRNKLLYFATKVFQLLINSQIKYKQEKIQTRLKVKKKYLEGRNEGNLFLFVGLGEVVTLVLFQLCMCNFSPDKSDWKPKSWARYQQWTMPSLICWKQKMKRQNQMRKKNQVGLTEARCNVKQHCEMGSLKYQH